MLAHLKVNCSYFGVANLLLLDFDFSGQSREALVNGVGENAEPNKNLILITGHRDRCQEAKQALEVSWHRFYRLHHGFTQNDLQIIFNDFFSVRHASEVLVLSRERLLTSDTRLYN